MKDHLEELMLNHREDFDLLEPKARLWEGVEKKMKKNTKHHLRFYISRAASVVIIFMLSFLIQRYYLNHQNPIKEIPELQEAEVYYSGLIDEKLKEVRPMLAEFPDVQKELDSDMSELDSVYNGLKEDLKDNVSNQQVIEAMIENYRTRINILEEMLHFLNKDEKEIPANHNKSEYEL
jgi:hypothetical protein